VIERGSKKVNEEILPQQVLKGEVCQATLGSAKSAGDPKVGDLINANKKPTPFEVGSSLLYSNIGIDFIKT